MEAIVGHRTYGGQPRYYVSFVDYDASDYIWSTEG